MLSTSPIWCHHWCPAKHSKQRVQRKKKNQYSSNNLWQNRENVMLSSSGEQQKNGIRMEVSGKDRNRGIKVRIYVSYTRTKNKVKRERFDKMMKKREVEKKKAPAIIRENARTVRRPVECRFVRKPPCTLFNTEFKAQSHCNLAQVVQFISQWKTVSDGSAIDRSVRIKVRNRVRLNRGNNKK